jgi:hypothetical protein
MQISRLSTCDFADLRALPRQLLFAGPSVLVNTQAGNWQEIFAPILSFHNYLLHLCFRVPRPQSTSQLHVTARLRMIRCGILETGTGIDVDHQPYMSIIITTAKSRASLKLRATLV